VRNSTGTSCQRTARPAQPLTAGFRSVVPHGPVSRDGEPALLWARARRELDIREELELRDSVEQARATAPAHVREVLGEQADRGPERRRYDELAADLEWTEERGPPQERHSRGGV
jgi:hypothetical protein